MNVIKKLGLVVAISSAVLGPARTAQAAGLLIAEGGFGGVLEIKEHDVQVTINDGIAVTRVTEVFRNTESRQVEALYTFPVPKGASVANFSMWINGKEMVGEVLEKKRAREIYESYKQTRKDPGLLEQVDYKTFEMRIFPIAPNAEQRVQITYYQELEVDHDWATYVYPLATSTRRDVDSRIHGRFALSLEARSPVPVSEMESSSHRNEFVIAKHSDQYYQASLEARSGSLARDVVIGYRLERPQSGIDVVTSRRDNEDGYFCLTITAGDDLGPQDDGMDYVFVLDISGSMADDGKLLLSKDSVGAFIQELGASDRFEVMTFNVQAHPAFGSLRPAGAEAQQAAAAFLSTQQARGGTVLNPAINAAYQYAAADRPLNVIILSDGLTEQRERQTLLALIQQRPRNARVFCIGVGNEVNRPLLEQMAHDSGGLAAFISQGDNFSRQAKAFRRKLLRPAATDLQLEFAGVQVSELEPKVLPSLYHGSPIRVYGRYAGGGEAQVRLRGSVKGVEFKQAATLEFPKQDLANPEIDRMWAWHKIDRLLKEADRANAREQVIAEIVRLGEGYSIASEYTSFLVLENDAEFQRWKIARNNVLRSNRDRKAQEMVRAQLDNIRNKAMANLGPVDRAQVMSDAPGAIRVAPVVSGANRQPAPAAEAASRPRQSFDFGGGSAPVGPLFVLLLLWLRRVRPQAA